MSGSVLGLLEDYAAHVRAGAESFADVGLTPEYLARCQEFDRALRALDGDALRDAAATPDGARVVAELTAARAAFAAAATTTRGELESQQDDLRTGAKALRGYGEAGKRGGPDARFLTRRG